MGKLGTCFQVFRVIFAIVNFIFLLIACVIFAVGVYLIVESQSYSFITGSDFASGAALLIVSGIVTAFIAALGFVGACLKWRPLLVAYAIILLLIVILQIIAGIIGFFFSDNAEEESGDRYRSGWEDAITEYRASEDDEGYNEDANDAVDFLQNALDCCGIDGPEDWGEFNPDYVTIEGLPRSCDCDDDDDEDICGTPTFSYANMTEIYNRNQTVWTRGCYNRTVDLVVAFAIVYGGIGFAFGIFEIIGIFVALILCCCISSNKKQEYV